MDRRSAATSPTRCGSSASGPPCATYAHDRGIQILGDVPIYVAPDAADERAWPQFFRDDAVAGCPPDAYAATGQLWGNPLYRWDVLRDDGYRWWTERLRRTFALFDLVRVDHFRGFAAYWAIPAGDDTALNGHWEPGPGRAVFDAAHGAPSGRCRCSPRTSATSTSRSSTCARRSGFPGMAVLQFGFEPAYEYNTHDLANLAPDQVVYTGTHDNDTVAGWWCRAARAPPRAGPRRVARAGRRRRR